MFNVPVSQWGGVESGQPDDYQVFSFPDSQTINRSITEPKDLGLALQAIGSSLYDFQKEVISTKRNQHNDAWLALCKKTQ